MNIKMFEENNLPHDFFLSIRQKQKNKIQTGCFLGALLSKIACSLMKVAVSLAKNILALLRITVAASAVDAGIQKKIHGSGTTTLIITNEEMKKLFKLLKILIFY